MFPAIPSMTWYTWMSAFMLALVVVGVVVAVVRLMAQLVAWVLHDCWRALPLLCSYLWPTILSTRGSAHFANKKEAQTAGVFNATGIPLGQWSRDKIVREPRGGHIGIFAPPRSWKSTGIIMPALEGYTGSVLCTDLRAELHQQTHEARERYGPVYKFDPLSADSCSINVLDSVRWASPNAFADVDRIVHHLLGPIGEPMTDAFRRNAIPLLRAVIFHLHGEGNANFPAVADWLSEPDHTMKEKLQERTASAHPYVASGGRRTLDMSTKLQQGVWSATCDALSLFDDPQVRAATEKSDVYLEHLLDGPEPVSLYLCMPFSDISRLGRFIGLLVEVLVTIVTTPSQGQRHKLLFCLDEAMNCGKLAELEKAVSYLQGSGAQLIFVAQNLNQVVDLYGETTPLLSSMGSTVFYTPVPTDQKTSEWISKSLGTSTVITASLSTSTTQESVSQQEVSRPLLTPDE